eukprot:919446-Heterocapsa_arctica.AAC.2
MHRGSPGCAVLRELALPEELVLPELAASVAFFRFFCREFSSAGVVRVGGRPGVVPGAGTDVLGMPVGVLSTSGRLPGSRIVRGIDTASVRLAARVTGRRVGVSATGAGPGRLVVYGSCARSSRVIGPPGRAAAWAAMDPCRGSPCRKVPSVPVLVRGWLSPHGFPLLLGWVDERREASRDVWGGGCRHVRHGACPGGLADDY